MGLLSRLAARHEPPQRREPTLALERRAAGFYGDGWAALGNMASFGYAGRGGAPVPAHLAENLSAVLGAVELIASAIASLPATLTMDTADGPVRAPSTATAWSLLDRPNPRQSWPALMVMIVSQLLLQGNAIAAIQADRRGAVANLVPVPWPWLNPVVVYGADGPRIVYDLVQDTTETRLLGLPPRLLESEVLHVRARSDVGISGRSVLTRAAGVIREGLELATLAEANWKNGMRPSGFVETGGPVLTDEQRLRFKASLDQFRGSGNTGKTMLLEGTFKYNQLSLNSVDAELLSTRQFSVAEVARMFCIPEPMLQTGQRVPSSLDPYLAAFAQLALAPIVGAIEAEFDHAILPAGYHLQLDMGGLLRGNYSAVMAANCAAVQSGIMTPNDARRAVGLAAHDDGDDLRTCSAPTRPADAPGMPHLGPSPGKTGDGLPAPGTHQNGGAG